MLGRSAPSSPPRSSSADRLPAPACRSHTRSSCRHSRGSRWSRLRRLAMEEPGAASAALSPAQSTASLSPRRRRRRLRVRQRRAVRRQRFPRALQHSLAAAHRLFSLLQRRGWRARRHADVRRSRIAKRRAHLCLRGQRLLRSRSPATSGSRCRRAARLARPLNGSLTISTTATATSTSPKPATRDSARAGRVHRCAH